MVKVYTKEHIAQMRIKDSPYAGAAHILGYGDKQREWIDGIKDARKAEEKRQKRKKIPGAFLKASGYLGVFLFVIGLFAGGFHMLSQAHNGGATTKPAVTSSVTDSPTPTPSSTPTATSKCTTVIGSYSVSTGICKEGTTTDTSGIKINLKSVVTALIVIFFMLALITLPMRL